MDIVDYDALTLIKIETMSSYSINYFTHTNEPPGKKYVFNKTMNNHALHITMITKSIEAQFSK